MFINDVNKKEEIRNIAKQHLRKYGIKYRDKTSRQFFQGIKSKKLFNVPLQNLENETVTLKNGQQLVIPKRLYEMCSFIFTKVETEGIFRKEGSRSRQNEIKLSLDRGCPLGYDHHVIDIAVVLKSFLRQLPEPLIPYAFHELLLRCSLVERRTEAILLACLLLPTEHLNVLAFLMQFLHDVTNHSKHNKMTSYNLSLLVGPNIFPVNEKAAPKNKLMVTKTCDIIKVLIENSKNIGLIPENIIEQVGNYRPGRNGEKVKRRRSGSLTRIFNGLKKIVGNRTDDELKNVTVTPDLLLTPANNYTAKKRESTKSLRRCKSKEEDLTRRAKLGTKAILERRWSTLTQATHLRKKRDSMNPLDKDGCRDPKSCSSESLAKCRRMWKRGSKESLAKTASKESISKNETGEAPFSEASPWTESPPNNYVRVSKTEYEDIKSRLSSIEKRLSLELDNVQSSVFFDGGVGPDDGRPSMAFDAEANVARNIQSAYEKTLVQAEELSPGTDRIARRLSRELRIRTAEQKIIRSPSERKIGNIKRRSRELERPVSKLPRSQLSSPERKRSRLSRSTSSPVNTNSEVALKPVEDHIKRATSFQGRYKSTQITFHSPCNRFQINSMEERIFSNMNLLYEDDFHDLNYQMFQVKGKPVDDANQQRKHRENVLQSERNFPKRKDLQTDKENGGITCAKGVFSDQTPKVPHIKRSIVVKTPKRLCHTPNPNRNTPLKVLPSSKCSPNL